MNTISILHIEDNPGDALPIQEYLAQINPKTYVLHHCHDLAEATHFLQHHSVDAILADLHLPDSSGMETVRELLAKIPHMPIVVLTGIGNETMGYEAVRMGCQDYLSKKEIDGKLLLRILQYAISRKKDQMALKALNEKITTEKQKLEQIILLEERLNTLHNYENVIKFFVEKTASILQAERCSWMRFDQEKQELVLEASFGFDMAEVLQKRLSLGASIAGLVARRGNPVLVKNIEEDAYFRRNKWPDYKTKSFLSVPVKFYDRLIGVVNVADKKIDDQVFSMIDLGVLVILSRQVAVALENIRVIDELKKMSMIDGLTKIHNYHYFENNLNLETERARRYKFPLTLFMIDVDNFKEYNDTYGHIEGDNLLRLIGETVKNNLRKTDSLCRYAGDEFTVVLPQTNLQQAQSVAQKVQKHIHELNLKSHVSLSIGIAAFTPEMTPPDLIKKADAALYEAKKGGKNKISASG